MGKEMCAVEGVERRMKELAFYNGKRVFVTGHTGFKGAWLCRILVNAGAQVTGYALPPSSEPNLYSLSGVEGDIRSIFGDIRDLNTLKTAFFEVRPEIVFHLAAQPIVRESYERPVYTYETNVMGTVNLLECVRCCDSVRSVVNVTTDKVYRNHEWEWGYRETDELCGFDPYSNSKSCSELVTESYINSFLKAQGVAISTARAGNVIGGGDFARDRIIPDCIRAVMDHKPIQVRNPYSIRPYQHVLEPLFAYLLIAQKQYENPAFAGQYNVGPNEDDCISTGELVQIFCDAWGEGACWENAFSGGPHEANFLKLDCAKIKKVIGWQPRWSVREAVEQTCRWTKLFRDGGDLCAEMDREIIEV